MDIYNEDVEWEINEEDIEVIEDQMVREFPIVINYCNGSKIYIVNGKKVNLQGLWSSYNPLSNIHYLLTGKMTTETFSLFEGSETDLLCHYMYEKNKPNFIKKVVNIGDW